MLNARQEFVVQTITREQIAKDLNGRLEDLGNQNRLETGDERLTDAICAKYASQMPVDMSDPSFGYQTEELQEETLRDDLGIL